MELIAVVLSAIRNQAMLAGEVGKLQDLYNNELQERIKANQNRANQLQEQIQKLTEPECGKTYIAGGTTRTKMLTYRENPYDQGRKAVEGTMLRGMNFDQKL